MAPANISVRHLEEGDYGPSVVIIDYWWGGRRMAHLLPRIFFVHFRPTSFAIEEGRKVIGFLTGFVSQIYPDYAYIHFVGIHPDHRRRGLGRLIYSTFFETVRRPGCTTVRCITSPVNRGSIPFRTRMEFEIEGVTGEVQGVSCKINYELNGHRVLFVKRLSQSLEVRQRTMNLR